MKMQLLGKSIPLRRKARCLFDIPRIALRSVTSRLTIDSFACEALLSFCINAFFFSTVLVGDDCAPPAAEELGTSGTPAEDDGTLDT